MSELVNSSYFGIAITAIAYVLGTIVQRKLKFPLFNAMVVATAIIITVMVAFDIPYEAYSQGGSIITLMVSPATACLALGIYDKLPLLKKNLIPVLAGCVVGVIVSVASIWVMCRLFGLDQSLTTALLPKSVTTPIAMAIAESYGGVVSITSAAVIVTGAIGAVFSPLFIKLFRITDPLAAGLAIGASSHAMGASKAMELGKTEGAMSGLAIGLCGIITAIAALGFGFLL